MDKQVRVEGPKGTVKAGKHWPGHLCARGQHSTPSVISGEGLPRVSAPLPSQGALHQQTGHGGMLTESQKLSRENNEVSKQAKQTRGGAENPGKFPSRSFRDGRIEGGHKHHFQEHEGLLRAEDECFVFSSGKD